MKLLPYALVLISAFTHAYWNFILKRAKGTQVFIGLSKLVEVGLFLLPFAYVVVSKQIAILHYWPYYVVGAALVILNYIFLGQAYKSGDLSLSYPISRAGALLFLPILAYLFIGERIDTVGMIAIALILVGLLALQLPAFTLREFKLIAAKFMNSATAHALLAAFTAACYTLWDKHSIHYLSPFVYFYAYTALTGIVYAAFILIKHPFDRIKTEWVRCKASIIQVGFFNTFTYMLVLFSLQTGKASYVIALRQLSIVFGVLIGWKVLQEVFPWPKKFGVTVLLAGCLLIALAR